jgi:PTS hybrid protein
MAELVGVVLVSHSEELARGLREILLQVSTPEVAVETAGGTDDGRIGTSYERIAAAIERAERGGGVVVLTDLGSAVLTARAVLDDLPADRSSTTMLVDAPFVEGAVAAAVLAGTGADLQTVAVAATEARDARKF